MPITGIGSSTLTALSNVTNNHASRTPSSIPPAPGAASTSNISKPAELLQKLQQLQQQDPAKFKEVASQLADTLQKVADQSGNSDGFPAKLAAAFKSAAQSGDLSSVQAALSPHSRSDASAVRGSQSAQGAEAHHRGHHRHGGGGAGSVLSSLVNQIDAALQGSGTTSPVASAAATTADMNTNG